MRQKSLIVGLLFVFSMIFLTVPVSAGVSPDDVDGDGILDEQDKCQWTGDGVYGIRYGPNDIGCPLGDADGDTIPDIYDNCAWSGDVDGLGIRAGGCPITDSDHDDIPNHLDNCASSGNVDGLGIRAGGCPIKDSDGDGIPNHLDNCAWQEVPEGRFILPGGCIAPDSWNDDGLLNSDIDRIPDRSPTGEPLDQCPESPGQDDPWWGIDRNGCPIVHSDADGIPDDEDGCPNSNMDAIEEFGMTADGCVIEHSDGDGIPDDEDACPNSNMDAIEAFGMTANGCVIEHSDGDGIPDDEDACPGAVASEFGMTADGCPIQDSDDDSVPDPQDDCPYELGERRNRGCPDGIGPEDNVSHITHTTVNSKGPDPLACEYCHAVGYDMADIVASGACNDCHSLGGTYNGVDMAQANWAEGVYDVDGQLKSGNEDWCATCHDEEPASSRPGPGIEVVVDNPAAEFSCEWGTTSTGGYNDGDYRWHAAGDGSCTATWTPDLPAAETYNVYAWWKASSNRATDAKYTIYYDGGSDTVQVNQETNGDQWNLLGTYPFAAGTSGYVVLTDDANEYVVADAVKFDNGSLEISVLAPNVIGDNVNYGFYVTGHNINCLSCHDASQNHIDHEHRTYDVDDSTYAAINPYGDSYRLQVASNKASSTLCFVCHNSTEVLGQNSSDVSHTNFWNNDASIANSHWLHVISFTGIHFDSDWDGAIDSTESCITCHNVHGSPIEAVIRHGELISSYGTTDKVPALNFAYLVPATEFDTATWTPDLAADTYSVYARWKASPNRATNARYTIYYDGGSESVVVNQQINGDQWNLLGTYPFAAGTSGYVELTDEGADQYVIADAIGWDTDGGALDIVVDDGDPEFATVGDWTCISGSGGYGDDYCYAIATPGPDPDAGVEESVGGRMSYAGPGVGDNGVCHACHGAISYYRTPYLGPRVIMGQAAPDTVANDGTGTSLITVFVSDPDGDVSSVEIDLTPIGGSANQAMNNDGGGYYSYQVVIPDGTPDSPLTFAITAMDAAANTGAGEAKLTVVDPDSIYVDNPDAAFVCDWGVSATGGYRDDYRWHVAGTGSCTATWTPDISQADTYNLYAWWRASSNRATDAKYTIYYDSGSQTVEVNQEINDSQWNYLGNFSFAAGTLGYVVLSDDANEYLIADAIKLTPSPPPPPETVIVDNPDAQFVCTWGTSAGGYGDDYRWLAAGTGSCTATWTPNLVAPASYSVYAWWVASPNRATDAPYTIYYDGGSMTVDVNHEVNGDQWNLLGTFPFTAGTSGYVVLSDDANEYVVADAIKFEP